MANPIDIKLYNITETVVGLVDTVGYFDIAVAANGDLELEDGFDTNLVMSLFCEKRAAPYEVLVPQLRRGWWGNETSDVPGFEIGSKLWLLDQARLTTKTINLAQQYGLTSLDWMKEDNILKGVTVETEVNIVQDNPTLTLNITLLREDNTVEYKWFNVWNSTGN